MHRFERPNAQARLVRGQNLQAGRSYRRSWLKLSISGSLKWPVAPEATSGEALPETELMNAKPSAGSALALKLQAAAGELPVRRSDVSLPI